MQTCISLSLVTLVCLFLTSAAAVVTPSFDWKEPSSLLSLSTRQTRTCAPFAGKKIAKFDQAVDEWLTKNSGENAELIAKNIAGRPSAVWLGDWIPDIEKEGRRIAAETLKQRDAVYTIALYNVPDRDCGQFSSGGLDGSAAYKKWIDQLVIGLGTKARGLVVLEPDALTLTDCLSPEKVDLRYELLEYAIKELKGIGARVYLDAGHPRWLSVRDVTSRLKKAGVRSADGFTINTSNSVGTAECVEYGDKIVKELGMRKGFVIDVSRNGAGPPSSLGPNGGVNSWCNVPSLRLGQDPTLSPPSKYGCNVHGLIWIKAGGESDGNCNGGPAAGEFWEKGAIMLIG